MKELYRTYKFYNTNKRRLSIFAEQIDNVSANIYVLIHNPKDGCFIKKQGYEEFMKNKDKYFIKNIQCYDSDDFIRWCRCNYFHQNQIIKNKIINNKIYL